MLLETMFEWAGAIAGISGAALVASHTRYSPYGWINFLISSACMSCYAVMTQAWGLLLLEGCFILTNLLGIWRGLLRPYLRARRGLPGDHIPEKGANAEGY